MANIFVFSASGKAARKHYKRTMDQGLELREVQQFFPNDQRTRSILEGAYGGEGQCFLWGDRGGDHGRKYWENMEPGDLVLGYRDHRIVSASRLVVTLTNRALGRFAWPDADRAPYELLFFLTEPVRVDLPVALYPKYFGKVYQGLRRLAASEAALADHGSLESFLSDVLLAPRTLLPEESVGPEKDPFLAGIHDSREVVSQQIRVRRGQDKFRKALRDRYGDVCQISGCTVLDVLEAAHIEPYRGRSSNAPANGLLLRADLHTLFDLNKIRVEPHSLDVRVHPDLLSTDYARFDGTRLRVRAHPPSRHALELRWDEYSEELDAWTTA